MSGWVGAVIIVLCVVTIGTVLWAVMSIRNYIKEAQENLREDLAQEQMRELDAMQDVILHEQHEALGHLREVLSRETQDSVSRLGQLLVRSQEAGNAVQAERLEGLKQAVESQERRTENIQKTVDTRLGEIREDTGRRLDEMRGVVDEKLQKTLDRRISESFQAVNDRLEQVYKGLGEMQNLAAGVGDLKKVLSGVKTRGILGEVQLGAILADILTPEQYDTNIVTRAGSRMPVEFAVRLPGTDGGTVYLPIDSKFPGDTYAALQDAYDTGRREAVEEAAAQLIRALRSEARDIREKYVDPPATTEFAIMFLPFEGLYAEAVRLGMTEVLQREYRITIAGPTTLAALLNSLQMGFRTLALQKRSGQVWNVLGAVKTEFDKFETVLEATKNRLDQAGTELDRLVGVRTRAMRAKLRDVTELPAEEAQSILELDAPQNIQGGNEPCGK